MNKKSKIICFTLIVFVAISALSSCWTLREKIYYSDKENFVTVTGVVTHMKIANGIMCIAIDIDGEHNFSDNKFLLNEANLKIVIKRNLLEEVAVGDKITMISAPKHFGDGYAYPIVEICKEDKVYLDFDEGYKNLMVEYD